MTSRYQSATLDPHEWTVIYSYEREDGSRTWRAMGPWRPTREEAERDAEHGSMLGAPEVHPINRTTIIGVLETFRERLALAERERVDADDMWTLLLCTVRYAMGRRSYITGLACDIVRRYRDRLRPEQVAQIADEAMTEIARVERRGEWLGDECDHRDWRRLVNDLRETEREVSE